MTKESTIKLAIVALAILAIAGAGAVTAWFLAGRHYQPTIDNLNHLLTTCQSERRQQSSAIAAQNQAISVMQEDEERRTNEAKSRQAHAEEEARSDYESANKILSERVTGGDLCSASSQAFDEELRRERSQ